MYTCTTLVIMFRLPSCHFVPPVILTFSYMLSSPPLPVPVTPPFQPGLSLSIALLLLLLSWWFFWPMYVSRIRMIRQDPNCLQTPSDSSNSSYVDQCAYGLLTKELSMASDRLRLLLLAGTIWCFDVWQVTTPSLDHVLAGTKGSN